MRFRFSLALAACAAVGCATTGPLPAAASGLVEELEQRGLQLVPYDVGYDRAFDRVDPEAHVVTYAVGGIEPPTKRRTAAVLSVFQFATDAQAEADLGRLRRTYPTDDLYVDGRLAVLVTGTTPGLDLALRRRFGPPVDV